MAKSNVHRGYFGLEEENLAEGTTDTKEGFDMGVDYAPDNKVRAARIESGVDDRV